MQKKTVVTREIDLHTYSNKLKALKQGEVFTIGRNSDCNVRPGCQEWIAIFIREGDTMQTAEDTYMHCCLTISRIHAFVERDGDTYKVYDCSLAGTVIVPRKVVEPSPAPKKTWWKRIFG